MIATTTQLQLSFNPCSMQKPPGMKELREGSCNDLCPEGRRNHYYYNNQWSNRLPKSAEGWCHITVTWQNSVWRQNPTASEDYFSNYTYINQNILIMSVIFCILTFKDIGILIYNFLRIPCYSRTASTTFTWLSIYCNTNRYLLSREF